MQNSKLTYQEETKQKQKKQYKQKRLQQILMKMQLPE